LHALIVAALEIFVKNILQWKGREARMPNVSSRHPSSSWLLQPGTVVDRIGKQEARTREGIPTNKDVVNCETAFAAMKETRKQALGGGTAGAFPFHATTRIFG
jgi:hypothetical protein